MWSDDGTPYQSSWGQHCSGCSCSGNLIELGTCSSSMWVSYLTIDDLTFINKNGCLMRVSYKRQELLALRGRLDSPPVFVGVRVAHRFSFLWCFLFCLSLSCVLCTLYCQSLWIVHS